MFDKRINQLFDLKEVKIKKNENLFNMQLDKLSKKLSK